MRYKRNRAATWVYGLGILLTSVVLAGCTIVVQPLATPDGAMGKTLPLVESGPLTNTDWYLTALGNTQSPLPPLAQSPVTITFGGDGQVRGNSGCNTFSGLYTTSENSVTINPLALTPTACADEAVAKQEAQFLAALELAQNFSLSNERLAIWYGAQSGMLTFTAAAAVTPTPLANAQAAPPPDPLAVTATPFPFPTVAGPTTIAPAPPAAPALPATAVALSPLATPNQPLPEATPPLSPTVTLTTPSNSSLSAPAPIPITFAPGITSTELAGTIAEGTTNPYLVQGQQGQTLTITLTAPNNGVQLRISGQDGTVLKAAEEGAPTWTGQLPTAQGYLIEAVAAGPTTNYTLQVAYKPLANSSTAERITWTPGTPTAERSAPLAAGASTKPYVLSGTAGQSLTIDLTSDSTALNLTINSPTGTSSTATMNPTTNGYAVNYPLTLPEAGDYTITLAKADQTPAVNYTIRFTLQ